MGASFFQSELYALVGVPFLIFLARICDVTIGTIRIIFVSRGMRHLAPVLGFFEVIIWLVAIGQVMQNLTSPINYIAYGLGFATGNYVGILVENRLAIGHVVIRVITQRDAPELVSDLRSRHYLVTSLDAEGARGPVKVIFTVILRRNLPDVVERIKRFNPRAFYTIEDVRFISKEVGALATKRQLLNLRLLRKGK